MPFIDATCPGGSESSRKAAINDYDFEKQMDIEKADNSAVVSHAASPCRSTPESDGKRIISFSDNDPLNPYDWTIPKKLYVVVTCMVLVLNSTLGSSLPAGATAETAQYFDVTNDELLVLPISVFLIGYVIGNDRLSSIVGRLR